MDIACSRCEHFHCHADRCGHHSCGCTKKQGTRKVPETAEQQARREASTWFAQYEAWRKRANEAEALVSRLTEERDTWETEARNFSSAIRHEWSPKVERLTEALRSANERADSEVEIKSQMFDDFKAASARAEAASEENARLRQQVQALREWAND